jgi:hypothetical protein
MLGAHRRSESRYASLRVVLTMVRNVIKLFIANGQGAIKVVGHALTSFRPVPQPAFGQAATSVATPLRLGKQHSGIVPRHACYNPCYI